MSRTTQTSFRPDNILDATEMFHRYCELPEGEWPKSGDPKLLQGAFDDLRALRIRLIREEFTEYVDGEDKDDLAEIVDGLLDIIVVAWGTLISYIGPKAAKACAREVFTSNLSKVDGSLGPIIRRDSDGKILKPEGWQGPRIQEILEKWMAIA